MRHKDLEKIPEKIQVLKASKATDSEKATAAEDLGSLAFTGGPAGRSAMEAAGALPPLVALLREGGDEAKLRAARALLFLVVDAEVAKAMVGCGAREPLEALAKDERKTDWVEEGRNWAQRTLQSLPETRAEASDGFNLTELEAAVKALESETSTSDEQCKAAEQLGNWAATSDVKRAAISRTGGPEALVALVVTGSDEAKCLAARALANLSDHRDANAAILKADGIAVLTPLAKHGKGKVKEATSQALKLLQPIGNADDLFPSGKGTRVAMFSARFDGKAVEQTLNICF